MWMGCGMEDVVWIDQSINQSEDRNGDDVEEYDMCSVYCMFVCCICIVPIYITSITSLP